MLKHFTQFCNLCFYKSKSLAVITFFVGSCAMLFDVMFLAFLSAVLGVAIESTNTSIFSVILNNISFESALLLCVVLNLFSTGFSTVILFLFPWLGQTVAKNLTSQVIKSPQFLIYQYQRPHGADDLKKLLKLEITRFTQQVSVNLARLGSSMLFVSGMALVIILEIGINSAILLSMFMIAYVIVIIFLRKTYAQYNKVMDIKNGEKLSLIDFIINNRLDIASENSTAKFEAQLQRNLDDFRTAFTFSQFFSGAPKKMFEFLFVSLSLFYILGKASDGASLLEQVPSLAVLGYAGLKIIPALQTMYAAYSAIISNNSAYTHISQISNTGNRSKNTVRLRSSDDVNILSVAAGNVKHEDKLLFEYDDLEFRRGEKIAIIGDSGSGKSTFLREVCLTLIDIKNNGQKDITNVVPSFQFVSQHHNVLDVDLHTYFSNTLSSNKQIKELLEKFDLEESLLDEARSLSGGEKQRLALIRAILEPKSLYFFDEVTSALPDKDQDRYRKLIFDRIEHSTCIWITHSTDYLNLFDTILEVRNKKLVKVR